MKIGLIVGSLRNEYWNKKIAEVVKTLFPAEMTVDFIEIADLPLYNADFEGENELDVYKRVRKDIKTHDAFIFFTPEYNRSFSAAVKNVIDIASVAPDGNLWGGKPVAVMSASIGSMGGVSGNLALRQTFVNLDMRPMQQPEVYLAKVDTLFENGELNEKTKAFLEKAVRAFCAHAKKEIA